jgi:hypothetical protein
VIGLQITDTGEDDVDASPWLRSPSRKPKHVPINEPIPREVQAVLSQRLYVEKAGLPSALINQIKRLAAFQNPEFYKKQNLRLSTALTPRVISCAEEHDKYIGLPRGCLDDVRMVLREHESHLELEDLRYAGEPIEATLLGELTDAQRQAASAMAEHNNGVVVAPPGFGKTVLGTYLISQRKCSTLILVHRQPLLATGRYIGEGFDDARLDTLFLALPVSWKGTLVQYAGRLHRLHSGKQEVRIVDYVDSKVPMRAKMFERRRVGYRVMGGQ